MGSLEGKAAVVTGASSGIGRSTALGLASEGCGVAVGGRNRSALEEVVNEIRGAGGQALAQTMDVRDERQVAALVDAAVGQFGRLDIMVNNAGLSHVGTISDGDAEQWREMLETNVLGLLVGCREAVRAMKRSEPTAGHIVNVSSGATLAPGRGNPVYAATKHAVNAISDALRLELRETGIRVTVVIPGVTLTNFGRNFPQAALDAVTANLGVAPGTVRQGEYLPAEAAEQVLRDHRELFLSPDDLAQAVLYAVTQPPAVHVDQIVVRPSVGLPVGG